MPPRSTMSVTVRPNFAKVCDGLLGSEGPVFDLKGSFYAVSPMGSRELGDDNYKDGIAGSLHTIDLENGSARIVSTPLAGGYGGRPAGCQCDKEGYIWIADMRLGILRYSPDGMCEQISRHDTDGNVLNGCNDLVFDDDGNLWVTGPGGLIAPNVEDRTTIFQEPHGVLYCLKKGATVPKRVELNQKFRFCNGIAVRGRMLLVAETLTQTIIAFDIEEAGKLSNRRVWAELPKADYSHDPMNVGGPDGMDFDAQGRLLVAHHGGSHLEVFSPDGKLEKRIDCPFKTPSNLHFKPQSNKCYVTEHEYNGVWMFEWECNGMPMYCETK